MASETCVVLMDSAPSRSAMVRETFRMRSWARYLEEAESVVSFASLPAYDFLGRCSWPFWPACRGHGGRAGKREWRGKSETGQQENFTA
jgi:hypothetical protein